MVGTLVLTYCARPQLGCVEKENFVTFQTFGPEICSVLMFHKEVWD